ncbi:DUF6817 domain-containing protein [Sorangium sp. So ce1151]|uniref:DUF6817 domain-containing protein n=1 Tax=Sorangium sp. So ce1151 TaxID=3133332 RepID=UPI003F6114D7
MPGWLAFLRRAGAAGRGHSEATLLSHLVGTRELLVAWGARPALSRAGLFHSVYGTESFHEGVLSSARRDEVRAEIGAEAELLSYLFCAVTAESLHEALAAPHGAPLHDRFLRRVAPVDAATWRDLFELTAANALEQLPRVPRELGAAMLASTRLLAPHLSRNAALAVAAEHPFSPSR